MTESQNNVDQLAKHAVQVASQDFGKALCFADEAGNAAIAYGNRIPPSFGLFPPLVEAFLRARDEPEAGSSCSPGGLQESLR